MKIIKKGNPYRKHKCSRCKTIFAYNLYEDVCVGDLLYCPVCRNYLDFNIFDKKITEEEYKKLNNLGSDRGYK